MKEVTDPDGERVVLDEEAWNHISARHPELEEQLDVVLHTVAQPDHRTLDPIASGRRYWRRVAGPSRWLLVIVDFGTRPARIVTAWPPPRPAGVEAMSHASIPPMRIGELVFDDVSYDARGDVLYLSIGAPRAAADSEVSPEGHAIRVDAEGRVIGVTLVSPRLLLERDGALTITLPSRERVDPEALAAAVSS